MENLGLFMVVCPYAHWGLKILVHDSSIQGQIVSQFDFVLDGFEWSMESNTENKTVYKNWEALNNT